MNEDTTFQVCPYLGLASDASTWCVSPTSSHRCHRWATPQLVEEKQQVAYCLSDNHVNCSWFISPDSGSFSRRRTPSLQPRQRVLGVVALICVLLLAFFGIRALLWPDSSMGDQSRAAAETPAAASTAGPAPTVPTIASSGPSPAVVPTAVGSGATLAPAAAATTTPTPRQAAATTPTAAAPTAAPTRVGGTPTAAPPQPTAPPGGQIYEVKAGDTLYALATSFGVTVDDLVKANNLPDRSAIRVGQKLVIPPPQR